MRSSVVAYTLVKIDVVIIGFIFVLILGLLLIRNEYIVVVSIVIIFVEFVFVVRVVMVEMVKILFYIL